MTDSLITPRAMGNTDAPHETPVTPGEDVRSILINQIAWSAVLAGVVAALAMHIILNLLGVGIGAATIDPGSGDNPDAATFSIGAGIWWTVSGIVASAIGGYIAGRTSGKPKQSTAAFHGFTAWATTTLVIFYLLTTSVGAMVGGILQHRIRRGRTDIGRRSSVSGEQSQSARAGAGQNPRDDGAGPRQSQSRSKTASHASRRHGRERGVDRGHFCGRCADPWRRRRVVRWSRRHHRPDDYERLGYHPRAAPAVLRRELRSRRGPWLRPALVTRKRGGDPRRESTRQGRRIGV